MERQIIEVSCKSHYMRFVKKTLENGTIQLRKQCPDCGKVDGRIYKYSECVDIPLLDELCEERRATYHSLIDEMWKKVHENEQDEKQKQYEIDEANRQAERAAYMQSPEWWRKRAYIKNKYNGKCALCFNPATDVHHLTYRHIFLEDERDLIPLCRNCHSYIHGFTNDYKIL